MLPKPKRSKPRPQRRRICRCVQCVQLGISEPQPRSTCWDHERTKGLAREEENSVHIVNVQVGSAQLPEEKMDLWEDMDSVDFQDLDSDYMPDLVSSSDEENSNPWSDESDEFEEEKKEVLEGIDNFTHVRNFAREILDISSTSKASNKDIEAMCSSFSNLLSNVGLADSECFGGMPLPKTQWMLKKIAS